MLTWDEFKKRVEEVLAREGKDGSTRISYIHVDGYFAFEVEIDGGELKIV